MALPYLPGGILKQEWCDHIQPTYFYLVSKNQIPSSKGRYLNGSSMQCKQQNPGFQVYCISGSYAQIMQDLSLFCCQLTCNYIVKTIAQDTFGLQVGSFMQCNGFMVIYVITSLYILDMRGFQGLHYMEEPWKGL